MSETKNKKDNPLQGIPFDKAVADLLKAKPKKNKQERRTKRSVKVKR